MSGTKKLIDLQGQFLGNHQLCVLFVSENQRVRKQHRKEYLGGRIQMPWDMGRDKLPALQRLLTLKCFDWQESRWGRKGKVTKFKFFVCSFSSELEHSQWKYILLDCRSLGGAKRRTEVYLSWEWVWAAKTVKMLPEAGTLLDWF